MKRRGKLKPGVTLTLYMEDLSGKKSPSQRENKREKPWAVCAYCCYKSSDLQYWSFWKKEEGMEKGNMLQTHQWDL